MRRLVSLLVIFTVLMTLAPAALAANDTPGTAISLTPQNFSHSDRLVGDTGGAVRFYQINYVGAARPVNIELVARPGRDALGETFGFKLYDPKGLVGEATVEHNEADFTRYSLTLVSVTPGIHLIQVYNFSSGLSVDFTITASGLAEATPRPDTPTTPGVSPSQPLFISQSVASIGGDLAGSDTGSLQFFSFEYAGPGSTVGVELRYTPPSPYLNGAVGFNLYRGDKLVAQGEEVARDGEEATVRYSLTDKAAGLYLLQVFNYEPGFNARFVLVVTGAAGRVVQATDNTAPENAIVLSPGVTGGRGTVFPGAQATFNYFLVNHPGGSRPITVKLFAEKENGLFEGMLGFNLYKGADLAGQAIAGFDGNNDNWAATLTVTEEGPTLYGIQVFDYSPTAPVRYSIYVTGL
jgi:hypothetical protein